MLRTNELEGQTNTINTNSITLLVEIFLYPRKLPLIITQIDMTLNKSP